jgi:hypothetical protein
MKTCLLIMIAAVVLGAVLRPILTTTPETLQAQYPSWTTAQCERVCNHEIWLGMTKDMALYSIGPPTHVNRSVSSGGTRTQWVYRTTVSYFTGYLYFRNGRLTSWQD